MGDEATYNEDPPGVVIGDKAGEDGAPGDVGVAKANGADDREYDRDRSRSPAPRRREREESDDRRPAAGAAAGGTGGMQAQMQAQQAQMMQYQTMLMTQAQAYQQAMMGGGRGMGMGMGGRGFGPPRMKPPSHSFKPGDWSCLSCNTHNFASRENCFNCQAPKSSGMQHGGMGGGGGGYGMGGSGGGGYGMGGGAPPPTGPGGQPMPGQAGYGASAGAAYAAAGIQAPMAPRANFKPGDWLCSSCQYHNYASRFTCFKCGSSRPAQ